MCFQINFYNLHKHTEGPWCRFLLSSPPYTPICPQSASAKAASCWGPVPRAPKASPCKPLTADTGQCGSACVHAEQTGSIHGLQEQPLARSQQESDQPSDGWFCYKLCTVCRGRWRVCSPTAHNKGHTTTTHPWRLLSCSSFSFPALAPNNSLIRPFKMTLTYHLVSE